jgi:hypothetical protein
MKMKDQAFMDELTEKIRGGYIPTRKDRERMHRSVTDNLKTLGVFVDRIRLWVMFLAVLAVGKSISDIVAAILER